MPRSETARGSTDESGCRHFCHRFTFIGLVLKPRHRAASKDAEVLCSHQVAAPGPDSRRLHAAPDRRDQRPDRHLLQQRQLHRRGLHPRRNRRVVDRLANRLATSGEQHRRQHGRDHSPQPCPVALAAGVVWLPVLREYAAERTSWRRTSWRPRCSRAAAKPRASPSPAPGTRRNSPSSPSANPRRTSPQTPAPPRTPPRSPSPRSPPKSPKWPDGSGC